MMMDSTTALHPTKPGRTPSTSPSSPCLNACRYSRSRSIPIPTLFNLSVHRFRNGTLGFFPARDAHSGPYTCTATNIAGQQCIDALMYISGPSDDTGRQYYRRSTFQYVCIAFGFITPTPTHSVDVTMAPVTHSARATAKWNIHNPNLTLHHRPITLQHYQSINSPDIITDMYC